jgi:magnesium-transporting ATPase (P-type)
MPIKKETLIKCINQRNMIIQEGAKETAGAHDVASPVLLSGSRILSGEGKMIVIAVGNLSAIGKIQHLLESGEEQATPLQQKLEQIAEDIGKFGLISAIVILLVLIIRFCAEESQKPEGS